MNFLKSKWQSLKFSTEPNIAAQSAIGGMLLSIIGMGFAATGFISPVMGAILQECIDILAIVNALRLAFDSKIKIDLPNG